MKKRKKSVELQKEDNKQARIINIDGRNYFVAWLIAETFLANPNKYRQIKFINGDFGNQSAANLMWVAEGGDIDEFGYVKSNIKIN